MRYQVFVLKVNLPLKKSIETRISPRNNAFVFKMSVTFNTIKSQSNITYLNSKSPNEGHASIYFPRKCVFRYIFSIQKYHKFNIQDLCICYTADQCRAGTRDNNPCAPVKRARDALWLRWTKRQGKTCLNYPRGPSLPALYLPLHTSIHKCTFHFRFRV